MNRRRLILCGVIAVAGALAVFQSRQRDPVPHLSLRPLEFDLPPVRESEFANARPGVEYVGARACAECHEDKYADWIETAHSLALADIDPRSEPPTGQFHDDASGQRYQIDIRDGRLWHTSFLRNRQGDEVALAEYPMRYVIGSGRFSRSYLVDVDGFLMESPCTWYANRPGWGLSPGYEEFNSGFERPAEVRCVACHAGRVEPIDNSPHRLRILTQGIDCERCHGPGALHVTARRSDAPISESDIAHPARLPRTRAEAICAQCHLHGDASVTVRGRDLSQFLPGMALEDFQVHYAFDAADRPMTVVGHFEQMRLSACYQRSSEFSCTTCHDPHQRVPPSEMQAVVRASCVECHQPETCGLPLDDRLREHPEDHCAECHMPRTSTEIPHFAFTHHRVAVYDSTGDAKPADAPADPLQLVPLDDVSWMPEIDQERCLGLAYVEVLSHPDHARHAEHYRRRAIEILEDVHRQGLRDSEVDAALARLHYGDDPERAMRYALMALDADVLSPDAESSALFALSATLCGLDRTDEALPHLERLVSLRRHAGAWHMLSIAREQQGDLAGAIEAALEVVEASPASVEAASRAALLLRESGDLDRALEAEQRARSLREFERLR